MAVTNFEKPMGTEVQSLSEQIGTLQTKFEANSLGSAVDIKGYTSGSNRYQAPSDGYVNFMSSSTSLECVLNVNNVGLIASISPCRSAMYVKRYQYLHFEGATPQWAQFRPLT